MPVNNITQFSKIPGIQESVINIVHCVWLFLPTLYDELMFKLFLYFFLFFIVFEDIKKAFLNYQREKKDKSESGIKLTRTGANLTRCTHNNNNNSNNLVLRWHSD